MSDVKSNAFSRKAALTQDPPISWLMKLALHRPQLISLAAGFTDSPSLPSSEIRDILSALWKDPKEVLSALQYGSTPGDERLRDWTRHRLAAMDGIEPAVPDLDRVVIGNGSQQILTLVTEILCDPGDIILIEDPTYFVYLGTIESCGLEAVPFSGIEQLRERLSRLKAEGKAGKIKLAYLVSYSRNPTGTNISLEEKKTIREILLGAETDHPIYILEDAAYRDLRFKGTDIPSFLNTDPAGTRTIYTSTYTKPFATGLKVGFGVLPPEIAPLLLRFKGNEDFGTSHFDQRILREAVCSGRYESHLQQIHAVYREKSGVMKQSLNAHFPDSARWNEPSGGLYYWVDLPENVRCGVRSEIFKDCMERDVLYVPGEMCYVESPLRRRPSNQMRLSFGSASCEQIREGISRLGEVLKKHLR